MFASGKKSTVAAPDVKACFNLRQRYGQRCKISYDPAYFADYGPDARTEEPLLQVMTCSNGEIFPWGSDRLGASTYRRGAIASQLRELDCVQIEQDGDDGISVSFDVGDFDRVAQIMKPRRLRRLSGRQRQALIDRGRAHQFGPAKPTQDWNPQREDTAGNADAA
jgi:hypothetical protein